MFCVPSVVDWSSILCWYSTQSNVIKSNVIKFNDMLHTNKYPRTLVNKIINKYTYKIKIIYN